MVKSKLDGAVDESSADQKIRKSDATTQPVKNLEACTQQNPVLQQEGWLTKFR